MVCRYPGRTISNGNNYRYGFGGQEKSGEIKGNGNSYTSEFWQYDARLGRRWNFDPLPKTYESPFSSFANNPINIIDPTGADTIDINTTTERKKFHNIGGGLDGVSGKQIPDQITRTGSISIIAASVNDVFRINDINSTTDENGNTTTTSRTTTLELNNPQTFYRSGGHNMKGFIDDRYALAASSPEWLLKYYASKSNDIGVRSAIAYQSDVPFAFGLNKVINVAYTVSGAYGLFRFGVSRLAFT